MRSLYILKLGSTYPETIERLGDFDTWLLRALGEPGLPVSVIDVPTCGDLAHTLPMPTQCAGILISGSHAMVTDRLDWSVFLEQWLPSMVSAGVPILGVCYGHQLLAQALGGEVHYHPDGREIGTVDLLLSAEANADPLFEGLPKHLLAQATHAQSVLRLPPGACLLAGNDFEPHHAFRVGERAWGVQFHPEYCPEVMREYIVLQAAKLRAAGRDVEALLKSVRPSTGVAQILPRFAALCRQHDAGN